MVYNGMSSGLNDALWAPSFFFPSAESGGRLLTHSLYCMDLDMGTMSLNFPMDQKLRPYAGVDLTRLAPLFNDKAVLNSQGRLYERWECLFMGMRPSPNNAISAANQISHLLLQSRAKREEFKPAVLYTNTCPHNEAFWKGIFGTYLETKLGLIHLLYRVMSTLDSKCELYCWKCVVQLRAAIYSYFVKGEAALLKALKDGSISKTGKKLSDTEIRDLRHSKRWKQRYISSETHLTWFHTEISSQCVESRI
jgi:hypothetical protein